MRQHQRPIELRRPRAGGGRAGEQAACSNHGALERGERQRVVVGRVGGSLLEDDVRRAKAQRLPKREKIGEGETTAVGQHARQLQAADACDGQHDREHRAPLDHTGRVRDEQCNHDSLERADERRRARRSPHRERSRLAPVARGTQHAHSGARLDDRARRRLEEGRREQEGREAEAGSHEERARARRVAQRVQRELDHRKVAAPRRGDAEHQETPRPQVDLCLLLLLGDGRGGGGGGDGLERAREGRVASKPRKALLLEHGRSGRHLERIEQDRPIAIGQYHAGG
mmetsp:Transcript_42946/g.113392  ORF Transcript_42946/g.113392 Transcript_42946/m.113392 type:complete len:285 (-) Transcript_42946:130-984(-)